LEKALGDGIKFYKSDNGVILSPGVGEKGLIGPEYFLKVVNLE
jgi:RNA:NAD 2'-phosphotransferase (TPT1/KptA family)